MLRSYLLRVGIVALLCPGCGTLLAGNPMAVHVASTPAGASIYLDNQLSGQTPKAVTVSRRLEPHTLKLTRSGYAATTTPVPRSFNKLSLLNVFFPPGFIVDVVTGAIFSYEDSLAVDMESLASGAADAPTAAVPTAAAPAS